jgi:hypothetical protein
MLDARTNPAFVEAITHFPLVVAIQFSTEKSGNICGFDRMSKGFQEMWLVGLQSLLALEDQISGIFCLHDAPLIGQFKFCDRRAIQLSKKHPNDGVSSQRLIHRTVG